MGGLELCTSADWRGACCPCIRTASRRSLVYFCALDEEAEVHALPSPAAKGASGFADWMASRTPGERRRYAGRTTQREWTEVQEQPAMQRIALKNLEQESPR